MDQTCAMWLTALMEKLHTRASTPRRLSSSKEGRVTRSYEHCHIVKNTLHKGDPEHPVLEQASVRSLRLTCKGFKRKWQRGWIAPWSRAMILNHCHLSLITYNQLAAKPKKTQTQTESMWA